jgi:hypothetical protein
MAYSATIHKYAIKAPENKRKQDVEALLKERNLV